MVKFRVFVVRSICIWFMYPPKFVLFVTPYCLLYKIVTFLCCLGVISCHIIVVTDCVCLYVAMYSFALCTRSLFSILCIFPQFRTKHFFSSNKYTKFLQIYWISIDKNEQIYWNYFFRVDPQSVELTKAKMQPWDGTNKTEDEKLTAWMVAENGRSVQKRN